MTTKKSKKSSPSKTVTEIIKNHKLDPEKIKQESTSAVLIPKMAILGLLDTIEQFVKASKQTIHTSVQGINLVQLGAFVGAIQGSLEMINHSIDLYRNGLEQANVQLKAKKVIDIVTKNIKETTSEIPNQDSEPFLPSSRKKFN